MASVKPSVAVHGHARPDSAPRAARLGAVVVLFNPMPDQVAQIVRLAGKGVSIVAVDNSARLQAEIKATLQGAGVVTLHNRNRGGIGGAYNRGVAQLAANDLDAFVLLDQDSILPEGFFAAMSKACGECFAAGIERVMLGPKIFDVNACAYLPSFAGGRLTVRRVPVSAVDPGRLLACSYLISSGCVVSYAAWRALGEWREDFVIDHMDTEYCLRASRCDVPLFIVPSVTLRHAIGRRQTVRWLGLRLGALNHNASRRYYLARNGIALGYLHGSHVCAVLLVNLLTLSQVLAVLLIEPNKRLKLRAMACGFIDGLLRRSGPIEFLRPRLAARCQAAEVLVATSSPAA